MTRRSLLLFSKKCQALFFTPGITAEAFNAREKSISNAARLREALAVDAVLLHKPVSAKELNAAMAGLL